MTEEHDLRERLGRGELETEAERCAPLAESLDRCWDLRPGPRPAPVAQASSAALMASRSAAAAAAARARSAW